MFNVTFPFHMCLRMGNCIGLYLFFSLFFLMTGEVRVASLNVNGARERSKRASVFETIRQNKFDVLYVQEMHSDISNATDWA